MKDDMLLEEGFVHQPGISPAGTYDLEAPIPGSSVNEIRNLQLQLNAVSCLNKLKLTGKIDTNTQGAIGRFRARYGLSKTADVRVELQNALRIERGRAGLRDGVNAGNLIRFHETAYPLSTNASEMVLRDLAAHQLLQMDGFGANDAPKGRQQAYIDILFWGRRESERMSHSYKTCPSNCAASSCGLVVRSLLLLLGARDPWINAPYEVTTAIRAPIDFARKNGALVESDGGITREVFQKLGIQKGDIILISRGNSQHIFGLVDVRGYKFISVDGGQCGSGRDGGCCSIKKRERCLDRNAKIAKFVGDSRPITKVIKIGALLRQFVAPFVILAKQPAASNLPSAPCPPIDPRRVLPC